MIGSSVEKYETKTSVGLVMAHKCNSIVKVLEYL